VGQGPCAGEKFSDVLAAIYAAHPEVKTPPGSRPLEEGFTGITAFTSPAGWKAIFDKGSGDCASGCITHERWYFEVDGSCTPVLDAHCPDSSSCQPPAWGIPPG
jgi:hypothetical protein